MTILKVLLIAVLFFSSISVAENYMAPLQTADWDVSKGESYCQLNQNIPQYGAVGFMHQSGDLLRFSIREDRFKPEIIKASLSIDNPPWLHESLDAKDYLVFLDEMVDIKNTPRLSVYGDVAEVMLDALSNGLSPTFSYVRSTVLGQLPETQVAISAVNFAENYQKFADCRKDFLPFGLKDLLEKSLFFKPRSQLLNIAAVTQLKDTARYIKEVKGAKIVIVSDTAITGSRDKKWFSNRSKTIVSKLKSLGVPKSKVSIKNGFYQATGNNKTIQLSVFGPDALTAIYYRKGNIKLTQTEKKRLNLVVQYAQEFMPNASLVIKSHTDSKGKRAKNLTVSKNRGNEVKRYLVSQGVEESKVKIKAYGESRPVKSNRFPKGRAQNRRVIIDFIA